MNRAQALAVGAAVALALGGALAVPGCSRGGSGTTAASAGAPNGAHGATMTKTFQVSGMMCTGCEAAIKGSVKKLPGVEKSDASSTKGEATVAYDPEKVSDTEIKEAIEKAGYRVTGEAPAASGPGHNSTTKERP